MSKTAKILAVISIILLLSWIGIRVVATVQYDFGCGAYLKRAANANTVEIAKEELAKAISYAEDHGLTNGIVSIFFKNPANDLGYWYKNMVACYDELEGLPEDSTPLEKTNVLMKLRESLTDGTDNGTTVVAPSGISIYPYNVTMAALGMLVILMGALTLVSLKKK